MHTRPVSQHSFTPVTNLRPPPRYDLWPIALQHAFRLRGALVPCGPGVRGVGWPDTPCVRLSALGPWLGAGKCASHLTAAWVWNAVDELGTPLSITLPSGRHGSLQSSHGVRRHEMRLNREDIRAFDELLVTSPFRTILDLLHDPHHFEATHALAVTSLLTHEADMEAQVRDRLRAHRRPYRRLAELRLGKILTTNQLECTR